MSLLRKKSDRGTQDRLDVRDQDYLNESLNHTALEGGTLTSFLPVCGNADCSTGWIRLWRRRITPRFEGLWACSAQCLETMLRKAMDRESVLRAASENVVETYRHRVPLGLMLYSQGTISEEQLKKALQSQREAKEAGKPARRIGRWLIQQKCLDEAQLATALSAQWNCPVYSAERFDQKQASYCLPRLFAESYHVLPLRRSSSGQILVAYEERFDHRINLALERMHHAQVVAGVMAPTQYRTAHGHLMTASYPKLRLIEVANRDVFVRAMVKRIEEFQPMDAALVTVHDYYWLRMWKTSRHDMENVEDLIAVEKNFTSEDRWSDL